MGLCMLVLFHALIPCLAAYILPPSPVLLHIYCTCFSYTFWYWHPYILQHLMEMFLLPLYNYSTLLFKHTTTSDIIMEMVEITHLIF